MGKRIEVIPERCTGCRICESICTFSKYEEFNPKRSRIRVVKMERFFLDIPTACRQCIKPLCIGSCPGGAISKDEKGIIQISEELCKGCEVCVEACPFGAISVDPSTGLAIVCDTCNGDPPCVKWCPTHALKYSVSDTISQKRRWDSTIVSAKSLLKKWGIPWQEYEEYYGKI